MEYLAPFAVSILIGLLIGIEREKAHPEPSSMGVRTFLLMALLGALGGWMEEIWIGAITAIFALGLIGLSYFNSIRTKNGVTDTGLTTEVAAAIVFSLGFGSHQDPALVALIGPLVALVLFSKKSLHSLTDRIRPSELEAAILILLLAVVVISVLEDKTVDPWGLFNPRQFGLLVLALAGLEFFSYLTAKFLGGKRSTLVVGFLGGLVSSTATTLSVAREAVEKPEQWQRLAATAIIAKLSSFAGLLFIVTLVSVPLALRASIPVLSASVLGAIAAFFLARSPEIARSTMTLPSPLNLKGVLRLAILLAAILAAVALANRVIGDQGTNTVAFFTGLFELQGISLATSTLYAQGGLSLSAAALSIEIAVFASLLAKTVMVWMINRGQLARVLSLVFFLMGVIVAGVSWFMH